MTLYPYARLALVATAMILCGCNLSYTETSTFIKQNQFSLEPKGNDQEVAFYDKFHHWLASNGFTRLTIPTDIDQATTWAGKPWTFKEVYSKPVTRTASGSNFAITIDENRTDSHLLILVSLTSEIAGSKSVHASQQSLVRTENANFESAQTTFGATKVYESPFE